MKICHLDDNYGILKKWNQRVFGRLGVQGLYYQLIQVVAYMKFTPVGFKFDKKGSIVAKNNFNPFLSLRSQK